MTFTHALATNRYGESDLIVSTSSSNGTHTTLAGALAAASAGQTIFLRDSVTENVTLVAGVNIAAWAGGNTSTPSITGKLSFSSAGTVTISGIRLVTNSDNVLAVTGSAASVVSLNNCYIDATNNTAIVNSSSSGSASVGLTNCRGNLGTTGISYGTLSGAGFLVFRFCDLENTGASTTATTASSGTFRLSYVRLVGPVSTTSTADIQINNCNFICNTGFNATAITHGGTGSNSFCNHTSVNSGTASGISVGTGATLKTSQISVTSSNTNGVTGLGTVAFDSIGFAGSSSTINTTTLSPTVNRVGYQRSTNQPAFLAYASSGDANVTGDGTVFTLGTGNALTEVFDQNGDFNTNGTFTAPLTGKYYLQYSLQMNGVTAAMTNGQLIIVTSNNSFEVGLLSPGAAMTVGNTIQMGGSVCCDMDVADTATFTVAFSNGTKVADVANIATSLRTYVSGFMIC